MDIQILAVGKGMPGWVDQGFSDYVKRFPSPWSVRLVEVASEKRSNNKNVSSIVGKECERIFKSVSSAHTLVSLDVKGSQWSSVSLAQNLQNWQDLQRPVSFVIGGADGLAAECLDRSDAVWSLSPLTFPHQLVKVLVIEQLYRAWSIMHHHPYHRA